MDLKNFEAVTKDDEDYIKNLHKKVFEETYKIKVKILKDGEMPYKAHKTDAGYDLFATSDVTVCKDGVTRHPLNIKMKLPKGTYAQITSKSGLGSKGLLVYAGVIDNGYTGIPHVVCTDLKEGVIEIKKGDKIAQMIIHPYSPHYFMEEVDEIESDTERGDGGFGSSGR